MENKNARGSSANRKEQSNVKQGKQGALTCYFKKKDENKENDSEVKQLTKEMQDEMPVIDQKEPNSSGNSTIIEVKKQSLKDNTDKSSEQSTYPIID